MSKQNVLIFADYYLPGFKAGGPIKSIANLVAQFSNEFNFYVITRNHDFCENKKYDISTNTPIKKEGATVYYLDDKNEKTQNLIELIKDINPNTIYLNSLLSYRYSIKPLLIIKYILRSKAKIILAPRGELSVGALNIKKSKKKLFLVLAKLFDLYKNITWHATSSEEEQNILKNFKTKNKVFVIQNLTNKPTTKFTRFVKQKNSLKVIFLSRISRKKNLLFAIDTLNKIQSSNIVFDIYGIIEDKEYWHECQESFNKNKNVSINYCGAVNPSNVISTFSQYDLFFFPTLGENFGHVILESLQGGCMVLTSNNTPWNKWKKYNFFIPIELSNPKQFVDNISTLVSQSEAEFSKTSAEAVNFINNEIKLSSDDYASYYKLFSN